MKIGLVIRVYNKSCQLKKCNESASLPTTIIEGEIKVVGGCVGFSSDLWG